MLPLASLAAAVSYCERGASLEAWAEPVNAATNAAYLIAAVAAFVQLRRSRIEPPVQGRLLALAAITAAIGIGSFAFHAAPSPLTRLADVVPISLFVAFALHLALRRVLGITPVLAIAAPMAVGASAAAVAAIAKAAGCDEATCLNGAPAYLPVLVALAITAIVVHRRRLPGSRSLRNSSVAFAAALAARTLDLVVCPLARFGPIDLTAHALWHLGTALTAYLVMRGLILALEDDPTS